MHHIQASYAAPVLFNLRARFGSVV